MQRQLGLPHLPKRSDSVPRRNQQFRARRANWERKFLSAAEKLGAMEVVAHLGSFYTLYTYTIQINTRSTTQK